MVKQLSKKRRDLMIRRSLLVVLAALIAMPALAASPPWTAVGTTAVIEDSSVPLYDLSPPYLHFNANGVGVINAYFNVTDTSGSGTGITTWNTLQMSYFDNAIPSQVSATLYQLDRCNGTVTPLCTATSSDASTNVCKSCNFTNIIDFNRYDYWVTAVLYRAVNTLDPKLFGLRIF
jgi:hypothetical protein